MSIHFIIIFISLYHNHQVPINVLLSLTPIYESNIEFDALMNHREISQG